jgi:hypothetical protein
VVVGKRRIGRRARAGVGARREFGLEDRWVTSEGGVSRARAFSGDLGRLWGEGGRK